MNQQTLGLLGSLMLLVAVFAGQSAAEFVWKDNKIVRQSELGNDLLLKDTAVVQPTVSSSSSLNTLNPLNNIVIGDIQNLQNIQKQAALPVVAAQQVQQQQTDLQSIKFDCTGKPTGPNKDTKYCDVYHACVFGKQAKTYVCDHLGERFYYDEMTQRCEFASNNPLACPSNMYFQPVRTQLAQLSRQYTDTSNTQSTSYGSSSNTGTQQSSSYASSGTQYGGSQYQSSYPSTSYQNSGSGSSYPSGGSGSSYPSGSSGSGSSSQTIAPWQAYVNQNEQFSCSGKQDGFYPSRWCNVFYRCFYGIKSDFLCAMNNDGTRLWWTAHSTSQAVPQQSAQCVFPCQQKRQCTSPGGVLMDSQNPSDSTQAAQQILSSCPTNANYNPNPSGQPVPDNSNDQVRIPDTTNYCQGVPDGVQIANPQYCNVFHVCIAGIRKDQICAKGPGGQYDLWWNDQTKRCDYPCVTQCSKSIYGSQGNAQQIQAQDRAMNPYLCGGSSSSGGSYGSSGSSNYPSSGSSYGGSSSSGSSYPSSGTSYGGSSSGSSSYNSGSSGSSSYSAPSYSAPSYSAPSPSYSAPSYSAPSPSYSAPSYSAPSYSAPSSSYGSSQPSYTYGTTQQSQPSYSSGNSYGTSQSSYGRK